MNGQRIAISPYMRRVLARDNPARVARPVASEKKVKPSGDEGLAVKRPSPEVATSRPAPAPTRPVMIGGKAGKPKAARSRKPENRRVR